MNLDRDDPQLDLWHAREHSSPWEFRESRRARRLTVRVFRTGRVEVVVPARTAPRVVQAFVERHREWIERKSRAALAQRVSAQPFPPAEVVLTASARRWRLQLVGGSGRLRVDAEQDGLLRVHGNLTGASERLQRLLRDWLAEAARDHLGALLADLAGTYGFAFSKLEVRRQRTRWGSCSTRGTISLNVCLMFQRPAVVRYLLLHELAHTRHMNHSARFWRCVEAHCGDWRSLDRELLDDGWRRVPEWVFADRA